MIFIFRPFCNNFRNSDHCYRMVKRLIQKSINFLVGVMSYFSEEDNIQEALKAEIEAKIQDKIRNLAIKDLKKTVTLCL